MNKSKKPTILEYYEQLYGKPSPRKAKKLLKEFVVNDPTLLRILFSAVDTAGKNSMTGYYKNKPDGLYKWIANFATSNKKLTAVQIKEIGEMKLNELLLLYIS